MIMKVGKFGGGGGKKERKRRRGKEEDEMGICFRKKEEVGTRNFGRGGDKD